MDSEIYIFAKCIISTFSDLITPKLQTSELSRKYQLFFTVYQIYFLKQYQIVNDKLKNIAQVEHLWHRTFDNFIVNLLSAIAAYCCFPKKPCINVTRTIDTQLALF